ncbi:MAG: hypothetical protein ACJA2G_000094 [Cognaticolwellia sp.]|jgi:hypothetical protein
MNTKAIAIIIISHATDNNGVVVGTHFQKVAIPTGKVVAIRLA